MAAPSLALALALALAGCSSPFTNWTPEEIAENRSGIYRFAFKATVDRTTLVRDSLSATLVINGQSFPMVVSAEDGETFEYEYRIESGANRGKYFFILEYEHRTPNGLVQRVEKRSDLYEFRLINQYVLQMDSARGPVGAEINILGRNFSSLDTVLFGRREIPARFISPNSLSFLVPPVAAGETYDVHVRTGQGADMDAGRFRVDAATLTVLPQTGPAVQVAQGETTQIVFQIDEEAPAGGLPIDVTTDIPASVIMREVLIPARARTTNVPLKGGAPGRGSLFIEAAGFAPVVVPVQVGP